MFKTPVGISATEIESLFLACGPCASKNICLKDSMNDLHRSHIKSVKNSSGETLLHVAIENKRVDMVRQLLDLGFDIELDSEQYLSLAVQIGSLAIVKLLLAPLSQKPHLGLVAEAAELGHVDIMEYIIEHGGSGDTPHVSSPLYAASKAGQLGAVKSLIRLQAIPKSLKSCLSIAIENGHDTIFDELIALEAVPSSCPAPPVAELACVCAAGGCLARLKTVLTDAQMDADAHAELLTNCLYSAARTGRLETVVWLLEAGANPHVQFNSSLSVALRFGHNAVARTLLKRGVKISRNEELQKNTVLMLAAKGGCDGVVEDLIAAGADVNEYNAFGTTPLAMASAPSTVRLLIDAKAAVFTSEGKSALWESCSRLQPESVKMLLEAGAGTCEVEGNMDRFMIDYRKMIAAVVKKKTSREEICRKEAVVDVLIDMNPDADAECVAYFFFVACAEIPNDPYAIKLANRMLVRFPVLVDEVAKRGMTALSLAIEASAVRMVELLLDAGADPNLQDGNKHNAMHYALTTVSDPTATKCVHTRAIIQMLLNAGAALCCRGRALTTVLLKAMFCEDVGDDVLCQRIQTLLDVLLLEGDGVYLRRI